MDLDRKVHDPDVFLASLRPVHAPENEASVTFYIGLEVDMRYK